MSQICSSMPATNHTKTIFIKRTLISNPLSILYVQLPAGGECLASPSVPRRQYTIEHINTICDSFNQIFRGSNAHQVTRLVSRHSRSNVADYVKHHQLLFTDAQPTNCITIKTNLNSLFETYAT